jgi:hypothetical protein
MSKFPKPYINDVKKDESIMIYVPTETMDIGARKSALPPSASTGPKSLEHVGGSSSGGRK